MKICMLNGKGGVGRTTLTLNLAAGLQCTYPSSSVFVADLDPQGSSLAWARLAAETPFVVGVSKSRGQHDFLIYDTPPKLPENGLIPDADVYVIPTLLDAVSYVVFLKTMELVLRKNLPHLVIANRFNPYRSEHKERLKELPKGSLIVRERAIFASAYGYGQTVFDRLGVRAAQAQGDINAIMKKLGT
ncbi:ParA family protein [Xanthomonas cannabis]|uniref:ParA family protein n=1 Tax=Xanthomonas cannabis TaxID=1885674 RepID=UPI0009DF38A4|nr:ParA family protein [Xanthomonas cannabis]